MSAEDTPGPATSDGRGGGRGRRGRGGRPTGQQQASSSSVQVDPAVINTFTAFQQELDDKYDRYDRITKLSKDITVESKRTIFLLHRFTQKKTPAEQETLLREANEKLSDIRDKLWTKVAAEIKDQPHGQYIRAYTNGMQENLEAHSFYHFLANEQLISLAQYQQHLQFTDADGDNSAVPVPLADYLLGIGDLGGELMRAALNFISLAQTDWPLRIRTFMRDLYAGYCLIGNTLQHKDITFKTRVLHQSLLKVEAALCSLRVRATEVPEGVKPLVQLEPWRDIDAFDAFAQ